MLRESVVLILDLDDTLAPSSTEVLSQKLDLDYDRIEEQLVVLENKTERLFSRLLTSLRP